MATRARITIDVIINKDDDNCDWEDGFWESLSEEVQIGLDLQYRDGTKFVVKDINVDTYDHDDNSDFEVRGMDKFLFGMSDEEKEEHLEFMSGMSDEEKEDYMEHYMD